MKVGGYLSKYLKSGDLAKPQLLTVERVDEEEVGDDAKLVVYFTECAPGVVLGKTTIDQIVEALGSDDTDDWIGHAIVAFNDPTVQYQGRKVGGIRFRKPKVDVAKKVIEVKAGNGVFGSADKATASDQDDLPF